MGLIGLLFSLLCTFIEVIVIMGLVVWDFFSDD